MNQDVVKQFFDTWSIYDEVLERNYMFHAEMFAEVRRIIAERFGKRPFSVLDLGCGSARHVAAALQETAVQRYVGFDLSSAALAHAGKNLQSLNSQTQLRQTDLLSGLEDEAGDFDLVFSSYAAHHLSSLDKQLLFQRVHRRLRNNGVFLLIDLARDETEETAVFLDRYCDWIKSEWTVFPAAAKELVFEHIRKNDFPETTATHHSMAARAGFAQSRDVCRFLWHRLWEFSMKPIS
jgi:SAM-dependent methyltransferase